MASNDRKSWKANLDVALNYITLVGRNFAQLFYIVFNPLALIALVLTGAILLYVQSQTGTFRSFLEIVGTITAGMFGGLITDNFIKIMGNDFITKKSAAAIRNLQLIKFKIVNVTERINLLRKKVNRRDFEEVDNLIRNVHKDILNSISDWSDVNPNAEKITDFYETINQNEKLIAQKDKEKRELQVRLNKLDESKTSQTSELKQLKDDIELKIKEINNLRSQVEEFKLDNIGIASGTTSFISGASLSPSGYLGRPPGGLSLYKQCTKCGKSFYPSDMGYGIEQYCENCKGIIY